MHVRTDSRIVFLGRFAGNGVGDGGAGGDDQGPLGADKNRPQRRDHAAILLATLHEAGKVVVKGKVDDAVGTRDTLLETIRIRDRSEIRFGAGGLQRRYLVLRPIEANDLMTGRDQILDDPRTDISVAPVTNTLMAELS